MEVGGKPDQHADPGSAEAVVPAHLLTQGAADQGREERPQVHAYVKDRVGAIAAWVAWRIEASDLGRDVRLERAVAEDQRQQGEEEQGLEGHHEMARRHQDGPDDDSLALTEIAVREQASENGGEVNEAGVQAIDLRRQGLNTQGSRYDLQRGLD